MVNGMRYKVSAGLKKCPDCGLEMPARGIGTHRRQVHGLIVKTIVKTKVSDNSENVSTIVTGELSSRIDWDQVNEIIGKINSMVSDAEKAAEKAGEFKNHWSSYVKDQDRFSKLCRMLHTMLK